MKRWILVILVWCAVVAFPRVARSALPEIFLTEEPELYLAVDKLEGYGLLPGLMTDDRGLEAREVAREARKAGDVDDSFTDGMLTFLEMEGARAWDFRLRTGAEYSGHEEVLPDTQGLPVPDGWAFRGGGFVRAAVTPWLAFQGRGDFVAGEKGQGAGRLEETSVRLGWHQATLEAGRFSLWWGPGRHGALLFTTNAQPLIGVRLRNPRPIAPGWPLRFLGLFQYDLFVARLEGSRPIPHSLLSGLRLAVKPTSWLELGASRAIHWGGQGHSSSLSTYWDILTGRRETEGGTPKGNSLASLDFKVRVPLRAQPIVLYGEAGAEDQSRPFFPSRWAFMGGVFFPSLGTLRKADLRVEYGTTITNEPGVWYRHAGYPHQYLGQILGHPMGTDARDLFVEAHYFLLPTSYVELNGDWTQRTFPGPDREDTKRFGAGLILWLTENWRSETRVYTSTIANEDGVSGADRTNFAFQFSVAYQYRGN